MINLFNPFHLNSSPTFGKQNKLLTRQDCNCFPIKTSLVLRSPPQVLHFPGTSQARPRHSGKLPGDPPPKQRTRCNKNWAHVQPIGLELCVSLCIIQGTSKGFKKFPNRDAQGLQTSFISFIHMFQCYEILRFQSQTKKTEEEQHHLITFSIGRDSKM